jgi:hypothetical protein
VKSAPVRAFAALIVASALLATACIDPEDQRPGLYLTGEVVETPVDDWSFSDSDPEIYLETRAWYLLPHSVAVNCAAVNGKLYIGSIYRSGETFPEGRAWNRNVLRNSHVRMKIGDKLYRGNAVHVTDPAEAQAALEAMGRKHETPWGQIAQMPEAERIPTHFFRIEPRS